MNTELFFPTGLQPSAIPLTIVCGPPAAGKSRYVDKRAQPGDTVIDLDRIIVETFGERHSRTDDFGYCARGLALRNERLITLATASRGIAWFVTTAAKAEVRQSWCNMLQPLQLILIRTPLHVCIARIAHDPARNRHKRSQERIMREWWRDYAPREGDTVIENSWHRVPGEDAA